MVGLDRLVLLVFSLGLGLIQCRGALRLVASAANNADFWNIPREFRSRVREYCRHRKWCKGTTGLWLGYCHFSLLDLMFSLDDFCVGLCVWFPNAGWPAVSLRFICTNGLAFTCFIDDDGDKITPLSTLI